MTDRDALTRPIIGIENRTAQEVFDIMCDRFKAALSAREATEGGEAVRAKQAAKPKHSPLPGQRPTDKEVPVLLVPTKAGEPVTLFWRGVAEAPAAGEPLSIIYTNWRDETAERNILPLRMWFGSTEWHPEPQWLLTAIDTEKNAERDFAWSGIDFQGEREGA